MPSPRVIEPASVPADVRADGLLACFIGKATEGDPQVCTYAWAYRALFHVLTASSPKPTAGGSLTLACRTQPRKLAGLSLVRLDTFIVSKKGGVPSDAYWPTAHHDREEWERTFGNAKILH